MKERTIYALGFFDGVHLGHQALLSACKELSAQENCAAGVITFDSHPDTLVLDAGDFSMGTLVQTVYASEAAELKMLGNGNLFRECVQMLAKIILLVLVI